MGIVDSKDEGIPPIRFDQLATLATLCKYGKQGAAEIALGKSQSQISRDLAKLEDALSGQTLFDRARREPTDAGRHVLHFQQTILREWHRLQDQLAGSAQAAGEVTLAADNACMAGAVMPVLARLRQTRPHLHIRLIATTSAEAASRVRNQEADAAILSMDTTHKHISVRPWMNAELIALTPSTLTCDKRKAIPLRTLFTRPILTDARDSTISRAVLPFAKGTLRKQLQVHEIGGGRGEAFAAVASGLGVAVLTRFKDDQGLTRLPSGVTLRTLPRTIKPIRFGIGVHKGMQPTTPCLALITELIRAAR